MILHRGVSCSSAAGQSGRPDWLVSKNAKTPYAPRPSTHHMSRARVCLPAVTAHAGRQSVVAHGKSYSIIDRSRDRQQSRRTAGERRLWQYRFSSERAKYLSRARVCVCVCSCGVCVWHSRLRVKSATARNLLLRVVSRSMHLTIFVNCTVNVYIVT